MSDLKTKIDGILSERKSRIDKISSQSSLIDSLYPNLQKMQKTISELGVDGADEKVETISTFLGHLDQAREKLRLLKKRYEKSTINIGVSGFTHAGKSTLLQAISGLSDNEIPKADEGGSNSLHATTAICSQIFNSPDKYAEIIYKNDKEFLEFVNAHLEVAGLNTISDKSEFPTINIPENKDSEEEKNTIKDRLRLLKESYTVYKDKIGNGVEKISGNNFNRLDSYVSYSKGDKNTRFFPAVKEVKIYCPFPALDNPDIKLCLVDLPGFGEFDKVDEIQVSNLKEIVDHIIFIYKTNKDEAIVNKKYRESYSVIKYIHPSQSSNNEFLLNFLSFLINEDRTNEYWQNHVSQAENGIADSYGNYKHYSFPALLNGQPNKQDAELKLGEILSRLAETLPKMDECLLKSLGESLNVDEIRFLLKDLLKFVNQYSNLNNAPVVFNKKGPHFKEEFAKDLERLIDEYKKNTTKMDDEFVEKVNNIKEMLDKEISETVLYKSEIKGRETWEKYIYYLEEGDNAATFAKELRRTWVAIINRYTDLDDDFSIHTENLKNRIAAILDNRMGNMFTKDENGKYDFDSIVEQLQCLGDDNAIFKAFVSLRNLNQNFRQNIYPYIFKSKIDKKMYTIHNGGERELSKRDFSNIADYKAELVPIITNNNYVISNEIQRNFVLSYFLIGALHTFFEKIIYSKTNNDTDFVQLCWVFRKNIYPEEFGDAADSVKVEQLSSLIEQTKEIISKF
jgi:hypothetical protein